MIDFYQAVKQVIGESNFSHYVNVAGEAIPTAVERIQNEVLRPSVLMTPAVFRDGSSWCALYGANLQEGVAGFGNTPHEACLDFDKNWMGTES